MPRLDQIEKLLALEPNDPFLLYALAQEHAKLGRPDESLAAYDRCLAADPLHAYACFHKARLLASLGRAGEAVVCARQGLDAANRSADAKAASELSGLLDELEQA